MGDRPAGCHSRSRRLHRVERRGAPGNERNGKIGEERERERLRVKRIRERERKLEREEDEKSVDGLSPAPLSRERERESGRGRDIRESFAELRGAPFGVPLCSL